MYILGFDIGGTKCAVVTAQWDGSHISLLKKETHPTDLSISPEDMIKKLIETADSLLDKKPDGIGISCGGPLDASRGIITAPPNLPGWDHVEIVYMVSGGGIYTVGGNTGSGTTPESRRVGKHAPIPRSQIAMILRPAYGGQAQPPAEARMCLSPMVSLLVQRSCPTILCPGE